MYYTFFNFSYYHVRFLEITYMDYKVHSSPSSHLSPFLCR